MTATCRGALPLGAGLAALPAILGAAEAPPLPTYRIEGAETTHEVRVHPMEGEPFTFNEGHRPVSVLYWFPEDGSGADVTREELVDHGVTCSTPGDHAESVEDVRDSRMWVFFFKCVGMR